MYIHLPEGIANLFIALRSSTSKLQRTAGSLGFISKCLQRRLTPTFAKVSGAFKQESHRYAAVKKILHANQQEQQLKLRLHTAMCYTLKYEITTKYGRGAYKFMARLIDQQLSTERRNSLKTKNKKINYLLAKGNRSRRDDEYCVPIINLTDHELTDTEKSIFVIVFPQSFYTYQWGLELNNFYFIYLSSHANKHTSSAENNELSFHIRSILFY